VGLGFNGCGSVNDSVLRRADLTSPEVPSEITEHVEEIREWFETYKIPDGKPRNEFAFDGQPQSAVWAWLLRSLVLVSLL